MTNVSHAMNHDKMKWYVETHYPSGIFLPFSVGLKKKEKKMVTVESLHKDICACDIHPW